ncbi:hypothetical protein [Gordonia iterans]
MTPTPQPGREGEPLSTETEEAFVPTPGQPDVGGLPVEAWLLLAGAALAVSHPRATSLLRRGGATRGEIGPTRLVLIHDETSSHTYRFSMNVPDGGYTKINPDGSATVYDRNGRPVEKVARPWAFDSAGRPQKTWYEVDQNGDLVQHVEPAGNALYPILADPTREEIEAAERAEHAARIAQHPPDSPAAPVSPADIAADQAANSRNEIPWQDRPPMGMDAIVNGPSHDQNGAATSIYVGPPS